MREPITTATKITIARLAMIPVYVVVGVLYGWSCSAGEPNESLRIAAVIRCLVSTQAWLRMREEFGVPGTESGPVVAWVIDTIIRELRAGNTPTTT